MKTSKVKMALEIIQAMDFFGISRERFQELKKQYGSIEALHEFFGNEFLKPLQQADGN